MQSQMNDTFKHPEFPFIPEALLTALDKAFPLTCPNLNDSERTIFVQVGHRQVIEFLRIKLAEQDESGRMR
jgi:hypothetical protein